MVSQNFDRPNVLFVLTDDQGPWAMGCAGNEEIETPSLDRLAQSGVRFDNFFCASPVCSPARASILTGRMPSQHGVLDWLAAGNSPDEPHRDGEMIEYLKGQRGYTDYLSEHGYNCGFSGKWHLGNCSQRQKGFTFWEAHTKGGGPYYGAPMFRNGKIYEEPRYVTDAITDNALEFLDQQKTNVEPFYLSVHYTAPHSPWGRNHHPEDLWDRYYNECPFDSVPFNAEPPEWVQYVSIPIDSDDSKRRKLSGYYTAVTRMDLNVGRLLDWLEENGLRSNTLVIFMSDNGMNMSHHGVFGKGNATFPLNMFEESVKVPCIMSRPGHLPEDYLCSNLLSQYDFMPTLLDYLDIPQQEAETLPGRSFVEILKGGEVDEREFIVVYEEYGPVRMIRSRDWKYVHRYVYGHHELYDLKNDPGETTNLVKDEAHRDKVLELRSLLVDWFAQYVHPDKDGSREPVTGSGQIGFYGPGTGGDMSFLLHRVEHLLP